MRVKRHKFQALVTIYAGSDGVPSLELGPAPRRMMLRATNEESHRSRMFPALISCDDDGPFRANSQRRLVTLRLVGDDVAGYLDIGEHFGLWLGSDVGDGVLTRRLFV